MVGDDKMGDVEKVDVLPAGKNYPHACPGQYLPQISHGSALRLESTAHLAARKAH